MSKPRINLVVVGHKDHGKSTLIGRLLYDAHAISSQRLEAIQTELDATGQPFSFAFLLDSLEEERRCGLTLDIMQMPFTSPRYHYAIIDCPGHREFLQKMLTGASHADAALLVVSASTGVEAQTRQHAALLKTLGIRHLVVAVNKMDAVAYRAAAYDALRDVVTPFLEALGYPTAPLIPVSALQGDNIYTPTTSMTWYRGPTLIDALDAVIQPPPSLAQLPLRAVVQDTYPAPDSSSIVACRVETGTLRAGVDVVFNPTGQTGRLQRLVVAGAAVDQAGPGDPVGLLVDGVDAVARGAVVSYPHDRPEAVTRFVAEVILFTAAPLRDGDVVTLRYGTAEARCRVDAIQRELDPLHLTVRAPRPHHLPGHGVGEVVFAARDPLCLEPYAAIPPLGRFLLVDAQGALAAGIVLDTLP